VTEDALRDKFSKFGTITSLKIMTDNNGDSRGFGFVNFDSADEAAAAIQEMHGSMIDGKPLYVALALRKVDRQKQLASRRTMPGQMFMGYFFFMMFLF